MALASSQTFSTTRELSADCTSKWCAKAANSAKAASTTYFVSYSVPVSHAEPTYCPMCPTTTRCTYRPTDLADQIAANNMGYSRKRALAILAFQRDLVTYQKAGYTLSIQELMEKYDVATGKYPYAAAYTPLGVSCRDCGSTFTMLRGEPVAQATPPKYCVWCGSKDLCPVEQLSIDDAAWLSLAARYDLPVAAIKKVYATWQQRNTHVLFSDYMAANDDDIMLVRIMLQSKGVNGA